MTLLTPNTRLKNRYQITRPFKEGGMGQLFLAHDLERNQVCVVKCALHSQPAAARQFRQEAGLLAQLRHPALPRVLDYVEQHGRHYLVMEYIPGHDLSEWLQNYGPAPEARVLRWANQVLDALEYLHSRRPPILHRDIKPANVKLIDEGHDLVKLVDFGIARTWEGTGDLTRTGAKAVSAPFSPWEQYGLGAEGTGPYSDIYALGATMYNLLSGQLPPEAIHRFDRDTLPPLRRLVPTISRPTEQAVQRAMAVRREARWASARQMRQALPRSASTPRPGRVATTPRPRPNSLPLVIAAVLIALLVVIAAVMALGGGNRVTQTISQNLPQIQPGAQTSDTVIGVQAETPTTEPSPTQAPTPIPPTPTLSVITTVAPVTPTPTPTAAASPTITPTLLVSPTLLSPKQDESIFTGRPTTFRWRWPGSLPANTAFEIRIWLEGEDPEHYGAADVKETQVTPLGHGEYEAAFDVAAAFSFQQHGNQSYHWTVAVVQVEPYAKLGQEAKPWPIRIAKPGPPGESEDEPGPAPGGGGGGNNNPPPSSP